jgi:hypothetical protein
VSSARRARQGWFRKNTAALLSLVVTVPLAGWWTTRSDYKSWYDAEPRDAITVAAGGTRYQDATWYAASVEVDPQPVRKNAVPSTLPTGTTRVRVYLRMEVADLKSIEKLSGCQVHLRALDGRIWDESVLEDEFQDRPTGCTGGYDDKPASFRDPRIAPYFLKPVAGKPFEAVAIFIVPESVASSVEPIVTWATKLPEFLAFPR